MRLVLAILGTFIVICCSCHSYELKVKQIENKYKQLFIDLNEDDYEIRSVAYCKLEHYAEFYYEGPDNLMVIEASIPYIISGLYDSSEFRLLAFDLLKLYMKVPSSCPAVLLKEFGKTETNDVNIVIIELLGLAQQEGKTNIYPYMFIMEIAESYQETVVRLKAIETLCINEIEPNYILHRLISMAMDDNEDTDVRVKIITEMIRYKDRMNVICSMLESVSKSENERIRVAAEKAIMMSECDLVDQV